MWEGEEGKGTQNKKHSDSQSNIDPRIKAAVWTQTMETPVRPPGPCLRVMAEGNCQPSQVKHKGGLKEWFSTQTVAGLSSVCEGSAAYRLRDF